MLRVRNVAARAIHDFFQARGFVWLHTPILTAADAEGAGAMFEVAPAREEFFGRTARLTVSGQLEAEIGALALGNVYSFGPTFRAENSNTSRHLAEFWMVEPEMAFCDLDGNVALAEAFLREVLGAILAEAADDMRFFDERIEKGVRGDARARGGVALRAAHLHGGDRDPRAERATPSSSRCSGAPTCRASTSASSPRST